MKIQYVMLNIYIINLKLKLLKLYNYRRQTKVSKATLAST